MEAIKVGPAAETQALRDRLREVEGKRERISAYTLFPNDDPEQHHEAIRVERTYWQGAGGFFPHPNGEWAIRQLSYCLNRDGEWEYEPLPSARERAFFERCRFTLDEALARARDALAPPDQQQDQ